MKRDSINIFWFRRDLRLEDNRGLFHALNSGKPVLPIFIFDTHILDKLENKSDHRVTFIHDTLIKLNEELKGYSSSLFTYHGTPIDTFNQLCDTFDVHKVFTNEDYEPYAIQRDKRIRHLLSSKAIEFQSFKDHVIFEKDEVVKEDGNPYVVFTPYKRKWLESLRNRGGLEEVDSNSSLEKLAKYNDGLIVPLEDMGFKRSSMSPFSLNVDRDIIASYDQTRNFPANEESTSRLGVHLRIGTLSIRKLARIGKGLNDTYLSELIWRDFYSQILYNFPDVADRCFREKYEAIEWENNEDHFEKWCIGETGYPLVDAGMRELNATGYMHNRVRMLVASFLTKHLLIDWRWGEAYFAEKLYDFDLASNNGGWQWAAGCGTDAAPYFRIFNPTSQLEKFDKKLKYVKKWIPEYGTSDYPDPIIDHKKARQRCLDRYKQALDG